MSHEPTLLERLKNPFDPRLIKWRVGATSKEKTKGIALAYIDARDVTKRLDDVCGAENWQKKLTRFDGGFSCAIGIRINNEWIWKDDAAGDTQVEPVKGGASDAFKRATAAWGVGRYLYYLPNVWVAIKPAGKSYALAEVPAVPEWAMPSVEIASWEDQAERELTADSIGADANDIESDESLFAKSIAKAQSVDELMAIFTSMTPVEKKLFTDSLSEKKKELTNAV